MNANELLRTLDAAVTPEDLDVASDTQAQALLRRITATAPTDIASLPVRRTARRPRRRLVAAAAVGVGAVIAAPSMLGGGSAAYAWVPVATPVTGAAAEAAEQDCFGGFWSFLPGQQGPALRVYVAEQRGSWTLVYASNRSGTSERVCLLHHDKPFGTIGADGDAHTAAEVPADAAHGSIGGVMSGKNSSMRSSTGIVGDDVERLVLHTRAQGPVTATINDGHYAAWWPDSPTTEAAENADTAPEFTHVTLTLKDGSTRDMRVDEFTGIDLQSLHTADTGGSTS
jgi:hypothetical protein